MKHTAIVGLCVVELHLPDVGSLKEKRSIIKSMIARLQNTFHISVSEVGHQDIWQSAAIAMVTVTISRSEADKAIQSWLNWIDRNVHDVEVMNEQIEIL